MEIDITWLLIFLSLGVFVGFIAGLLGIGGGGILVPILTSIFIHNGVSIENAVHMGLGTAMTSIIITSFSSARAHNKRNNISWEAFKPMFPGVLIGTFTGTILASKTNSLALSIFFVVFMTYVSIQLFRDKKPKPECKLLSKSKLFVAGGGIGGISSLVSIGGGSLTVPFLIWQNIDGKKAIGTSAALGFPLSVAGAIGYIVNGGGVAENVGAYTFGYVYLPAVLFISFATFFTAQLGAKYAQILPISTLKKILGTLNMILAINMFYLVMKEFI